jgi:two-component system sensor histidine kinase/response regulator
LNLLSNAVKFTDKGTILISAQCVVMADGVAEQAVGASPEQPFAGSADIIAGVAREGRPVTSYIAVKVRDTGIGIAPEDLPLIFDEFRQISSRRSEKQGSGLGLSISRGLIEAHGGRIWVESTPGQGSTFTFTLPCVLEPRADQRPAANEGRPTTDQEQPPQNNLDRSSFVLHRSSDDTQYALHNS